MPGFFEDIGDTLADKADQFTHWVRRIFVKEVAPALESFIHQFFDDFGNAALTEGGAFAAQVLAGGSTKDAGQQLLDHLVTKGVNIATHDALDVAMNAIRVHVTALQAAEQAANPLSKPPADTPEPATEATTA